MSDAFGLKNQYAQLPGHLLPWFEENRRELPWRSDREPYHVWLSEIMLQQTRVEAVKGYYTRFLAACPDIPALAACDDEKLRKLWEGLGYYSRVRNLKKAAVLITERHNGVFPQEYDAVRALPGVGDYTAGAVMSICFEKPEPAVDGNVLRVISRFAGDARPVTDEAVKREMRENLRPVYPAGSCGAFTQALMELGALVCVPNGTPQCAACPLASCCRSREAELWRTIPVKEKKKPRREETKTVFILRCGDGYILHKRPEKGLLAAMWELPNIQGRIDLQAALAYLSAAGFGNCIPERRTEKKHVFTHIEWTMPAWYMQCSAVPTGYTCVSPEQLRAEYSLPSAFRQFLEPEA